MEDKFSEKAKLWDSNPLPVKMSQVFCEELQKNFFFNKDYNLLEFGCGTGLVGLHFASIVNSLLMVDTSQAMLAILRDKIAARNIHNVSVLHGDIATLNIPKSSIDVIFSLMAFHHVENIDAILKTFQSILKPEGTVIIGDLVTEDGNFHGEERVAHNGFDVKEIEKIFISNNYKVHKVYVYNTIQKPDSKGKIRDYEQFLLIAKK